MGEEARFFAIRTKMGQEYNVALILRNRVNGLGIPVYSFVVLPGLKGMIIAEAPAPHYVLRAISGVRHVKGMVKGAMSYKDIEKFVAPRPMIDIVQVNDIVEITGGPFMGMRGRVVQVDKSRGEVKIEISEASYPLPITINADFIKIIQRGSSEGQ